MTLTGFAVCTHTCVCINIYMHKIIRCYSPNRDSYGVLAANKNELAALSKGCRCWCWCCGPGCWCCELAERAFKTGRCHKLAVQAACILAPASRVSTGRRILRSYLGLCWCNFFHIYTYIHTYRQTDGRTDGQTDGRTDGQTYIHIYIYKINACTCTCTCACKQTSVVWSACM